MTNPADSKSPVTDHPAFPAIVALWFAALLGLGSMVLPVALLESVVTTTGLAAIIPGAEPPLGFTARGLIALVAAVSGAIAGLMLARRVAGASRQPRSNRLSGIVRTTNAATPRPINAHEELGSEGLAVAGARRRSLSVTDEARPSDFLAHAPVPGAGDHAERELAQEQQAGEPSIFAAPSFDPHPFDTDAEDTFDLRDLGDEHAPEGSFGDEPITVGEYFAASTLTDDAIESVEMDDDQELQHSSIIFQPIPAAETQPAPVTAIAAPSISIAPGEPISDDMGLPNLVEQLGRSMVRRRQAIASAAILPQPERAPIAAIAAAPEAVSSPSPAPANPDLHVARPEEAAQAMAAYFGKPAAIGTPRDMAPPATFDLPAAEDTAVEDEPAPEFSSSPAPAASFPPFLPVADDDSEDLDDFTASFNLPRHSLSQFNATAEPASDLPDMMAEADETETEEDDEPFSSLLSLNNPFVARSHGFVRVDEADEEEEPVAGHVVFPGQDAGLRSVAAQGAAESSAARLFDRPGSTPTASRTAPGEMDDALRSALAKLQRMSGAA